MKLRNDYTGQKFGRLTVLQFCGKYRGTSFSAWRCVCDCGKEIVTSQRLLKVGNVTSCGCLRIDMLVQRNTTHGSATSGKSPTYKIWQGMMSRCFNPNRKGYTIYGGRGITVAEPWKSFENFFADMGERPSGLTLERIDVNGMYCKENCKWATTKEQALNRRNSRTVTIGSQTKNVSEWAKDYGVSCSTLTRRLDRGVEPLTAMTGKSHKIGLKLSETDVEEITQSVERNSDLAKRFQVDPSYISHIKRRATGGKLPVVPSREVPFAGL